MRAIVSVATGPHYVTNLMRLLDQVGSSEVCITYEDSTIPDDWPTHEENPYAFKCFAIEKAVSHGAEKILWMDSSVVVLKPLEPLWDLIGQQGYWFSRNYGFSNGQFTSDVALEIMGCTREQAFDIPHVVASCFGLDMSNGTARAFLNGWRALAEVGAFKGDRGDLSGGFERKFYGHRNDQSCASQLCYLLGMKLTIPPDYFAEQGAIQSDKTILTLER